MRITNKFLQVAIFILFLSIQNSQADDVTQSNVNGGNTQIDGNMTTATTYESGSSSASTTTSTSTSNIKSAPPTASAPQVNSSGMDVCSTGASLGVQTFGFGVSGGKSFRDENCERIKLSRQLDSMGMKVAAVSILCQDNRVFKAMEMAGTPCPYMGEIGATAQALWDNDPDRIPVDDGKEKNDSTTALTVGGVLLAILLIL